MPLMQGKSKKAFGHNVGAEMHAGKPQNQALAIAYNIKRKNKMAKGGYPVAKDPNYAMGGEVEDDDEVETPEEQAHEDIASEPEEPYTMIDANSIVRSLRAKKMAAGGEVNDNFLSDEENTELPDEAADEELPEARRKRMLSKAFEMVRQRQTRIQE